MASSSSPLLLLLLFINGMLKLSLASLYSPPQTLLKYHNGPVLGGVIPVPIVWYGKFSSNQKSIISDFISSLSPQSSHHGFTSLSSSEAPTVSQWWEVVDKLVQKAGRKRTNIVLSTQISDENCSLGRILKKPQLAELAAKAGSRRAGIVLVLTAEDVAVEGFCMSNCGLHSSVDGVNEPAYVWIGNSAVQCPGQCAWPFHQPIYGPQTAPLVAPNGDVGVDGMVINVAKLVAGAVTNPFGRGYFQGDAAAPVEVAAACPGVYGRGAYPGYPGELKVDAVTGGSYNVVGEHGRKFLVPALFDPAISACSPVV